MLRFLAAAGAISLLASNPASAATLITDSSGQLTGASGVMVNSISYEVQFGGSTCSAFFSGCDEDSDFDFSDFTLAEQAAQALLDQVFVNAFDASPNLTLGCTNTTQCLALIPVKFNTAGTLVDGVRAWNSSAESLDSWARSSVNPSTDYGAQPNTTFARFRLTSAVGAVPEPSTWMMMILGIGFVGGSMRSARRKIQTKFAVS